MQNCPDLPQDEIDYIELYIHGYPVWEQVARFLCCSPQEGYGHYLRLAYLSLYSCDEAIKSTATSCKAVIDRFLALGKHQKSTIVNLLEG